MKSSITHLPEKKQAEIQMINKIIQDVVHPEMIILFGSYAKGTYVEHRYKAKDGTDYEYISDYDFLVVTSDNQEKASTQENHILTLTENIDPPVNLEIHGIDYINKGLELGEYFFSDIVKEGVVLFDRQTVAFAEPQILTASEKKEKAQRYYNTWFPQGSTFLKGARFFKGEGDLKIAAFQLHQAAESLYYAVLLVFTDYKPKVHNLWRLRKKAKPYSEKLFQVFKSETNEQDKHLFELLKKGYIDARYRADYSITLSELEELTKRVDEMCKIVEEACTGKFASITN